MTRPAPITLSAIPGQLSTHSASPADAVAAAIYGVTKLSEGVLATRLWGVLEPAPVTVRHDARRDILVMVVDFADAWRLGAEAYRVIEWRWGMLRQRSDLSEELGWHPTSSSFCGLWANWQSALVDAVAGRCKLP